MGVLSPLRGRPPSCRNGRLGFYPRVLLWVVSRSQEHIDNLAGGTFFLLKAQEAQALFEKIIASERESEEYAAKENSRATNIDPLTQKFQGLALN
jgi:hypothetical protein